MQFERRDSAAELRRLRQSEWQLLLDNEGLVEQNKALRERVAALEENLHTAQTKLLKDFDLNLLIGDNIAKIICIHYHLREHIVMILHVDIQAEADAKVRTGALKPGRVILQLRFECPFYGKSRQACLHADDS